MRQIQFCHISLSWKGGSIEKLSFDKLALFSAVGYIPHPGGQEEFHNSLARFRVPICGWRWGKSIAAAMEVLHLLIQPNRNIWIVGPTYDLGEKEFRYVYDFYKNKLKLPFAQGSTYRPAQGKMRINTPLNSFCEVKSAQFPDSLEGESLDLAVMSEAAKHRQSTWEWHIRARLTDRKGATIFPTTPEGFNWIYDLWKLGQDPSFPDWASWKFPSWMNPHLDKAEIEAARGVMSEHTFGQGYGAEFSQLAGRVYSMFDEGVHVGSYKYNAGWPLYRVIDFGFTNPFACAYVQIDPSDNVYIIDEYYVKGKVVEDHAASLKAIEQRTQYEYTATYADAEDPNGIATLRKHGVKALAIASPVEMGVDQVRAMLQVQASTRKPRLFIDHSCVNTILEFTMYQYPETRDHQFVKEQPKKKHDHIMDPIRNLVWLKLRMPSRGRVSDIVTVPSRVDLGDLEL